MPALRLPPPPPDITTQCVPRGTWVKDCPRLIQHASSTFHSCRPLWRTSKKVFDCAQGLNTDSFYLFGFLKAPPQASFLPSRSVLLWCHAFCWPDAKAVLTPPVPSSTRLPRFIGKEVTSWNGQTRWMASVGNSLRSLISSDPYRWAAQTKQHMKPSSHRPSVKWQVTSQCHSDTTKTQRNS